MDEDLATPQVRLPLVDGRRSSTALGRSVLGDALREVDPTGADAAEAERNWRSGYVRHFARAVEVTAGDGAGSERIARAGLSSLSSRMRWASPDGETALAQSVEADTTTKVHTDSLDGTAPPAAQLEVPYRGELLHGTRLLDQLHRWVDAGVLEPAFASTLQVAIEDPEVLRLAGRPLIVLGGAAALGPTAPFARWGVPIAAVDLPTSTAQDRIASYAKAGAARVLTPRLDTRGCAGLSLDAEPGLIAGWLDRVLDDLDIPAASAPVIAAAFYADGATHVALTAAHIALSERLRARLPDTALAYLATPTDAFLAPADAVAQARARWQDRRWNTPTRRLLRRASADRLFRPAYAESALDEHDTAWGVVDTLVPAQGPNYALAKRAQRWHAMVAAADGATVSANVAPSSWTTSVTKNKALAAAFRAAHRFGVEVFDADTSATLMAAKLAADLAETDTRGTPLHLAHPAAAHPEALFSRDAAHGGLWRQPFEPRSALTVAGLEGLAIRSRKGT